LDFGAGESGAGIFIQTEFDTVISRIAALRDAPGYDD
jgi:hypothetical protein